MKNLSFSSLVYENNKKKTRREKIVEKVNQVTPWLEIKIIVEPYYPKAGNGRQLFPFFNN